MKMSRDKWRQDYISTVLPFLSERKTIEGGELCQYCRNQGLREPWHHNEWVSMPMILASHEFIAPVGKINPSTSHSHIDQVTLWVSLLHDPKLARQKDLFGHDL
jgi:hypothetical protein